VRKIKMNKKRCQSNLHRKERKKNSSMGMKRERMKLKRAKRTNIFRMMTRILMRISLINS